MLTLTAIWNLSREPFGFRKFKTVFSTLGDPLINIKTLNFAQYMFLLSHIDTVSL